MLNSAPIANPDSFTIVQGAPLAVSAPGVMVNDTDADGDFLTSLIVSTPSNGALDFSADGSFSYTSNANFLGTDSFSYEVYDGQAYSNVATVTIQVITQAYQDYLDHVDQANTTFSAAVSNDLDVYQSKVNYLWNSSVSQANSDYQFYLEGVPLYYQYYVSVRRSAYSDYLDAVDQAGLSGSDALQQGTESWNQIESDWSTAEQQAWDTYSTTESGKWSDFGAFEDSNWNDYQNQLTTLQTNYDSGVSDASSQYNTSTNNAFSDWQTTEQNAWDTYTAAVGNPDPADRITEPDSTVPVPDPAPALPDAGARDPDSWLSQELPVPDRISLVPIDGPNQAPTVDAGNFAIDENSANGTIAGTVTGSDPENDAFRYRITGGNTDNAFTIDPNTGDITVADGSKLDFETTNLYVLTVEASDGWLTGSATIDITINDVNDAPVAAQTSVYLDAANGVYDDIALLANGYDEDGDTLTTQILSGPSHGTLTLDPGTGEYTYQADSGYFGTDVFTYVYSDGQLESEPVTVTVPVFYDSSDRLSSTFQSFGDLTSAVFDAANGQPHMDDVSQGSILDCWFVASAAGLANVAPNAISGGMITPVGGGGAFTVSFPGEAPLTVSTPIGDGHDYSSSDGDWLKILEKAAGLYYWQQGWSPGSIYDYINTGGYASSAIYLLTGSSYDTDNFWNTYDSTTRSKLTTAFSADPKKVVAAETGSGTPETSGLEAKHSYTVVAWDAANDRVELRNPWGHNRNHLYYVTDQATAPHFATINLDNDGLDSTVFGEFWMTLSQFTRSFGSITYQQ